ncbi:DUF3782 domain-containing protein [Halorhodospira abdelmalekii]|uniref:DUF3782 domain-containing protein n=1 Tax=Halorhodospira abdelmalekii TaxID=421629 RepID=UPI00190741EE|nr:DUF3782 domain-containing protein [Halorhodospira abdelmalekii]MBK1736145.1 DUF3782 domain-containing protein [Halorhodospira abdelmalekii]
MSQAQPTFEDVWRLFQEGERRLRETERLMKESRQETERQFQETARQFQETERQFQETERQFQDTDQRLKQLSKNLGDLGNRLGEFVEHQVAPAVVRLFREKGIEVHSFHPQMSTKRNGEALEIDLLVVNDGDAVLVECKRKLAYEHIDAHLARLEKFKRIMPLYKGHRVMGAVAGMVVSDDVAAAAIDKGLYVLCQNGDQIEVRNLPTFSPAIW